MHTLVFVAIVVVSDRVNGLRIFREVLFDNLQALFGVFPVLSDMLGSTSMLIVLEIIINGTRGSFVRNEPHIVWDVRLLRKVFDIEADVDHLSFIFIRAVEGNQEAASQFVDDASVKLQHAFNFLVAVESLGSRRLLGVTILISL
jgi:hypothetical protein